MRYRGSGVDLRVHRESDLDQALSVFAGTGGDSYDGEVLDFRSLIGIGALAEGDDGQDALDAGLSVGGLTREDRQLAEDDDIAEQGAADMHDDDRAMEADTAGEGGGAGRVKGEHTAANLPKAAQSNKKRTRTQRRRQAMERLRRLPPRMAAAAGGGAGLSEQEVDAWLVASAIAGGYDYREREDPKEREVIM